MNSPSHSCLPLSGAADCFTEVMVKGGLVQMREPGDLFVIFICRKAVVYPRVCFIPVKHSLALGRDRAAEM